MSVSAGINAVIFDFGGVVVDWDPWLLYQTVFKSREEFELFLRDSRFHEFLVRSDSGETFDCLVEEMKTYAPHCAQHADLYSKRFLESIVGLYRGTVELIESLKALQIPLYGLTNWSAETFPLARNKYSVFDHFDDIIVSGVEKLAKPDPRIYQLAVQRWNLSPARSLFIDDRVENVEAAQRSGINGIHFESPERLRAELERYFPEL
jgi:2-haloacid dehalogenase